MKKPLILIPKLITVILLFSLTVMGQNYKTTGPLLNKRYPPVNQTSVLNSVGGKTSKAPLQSISVNEDPVFNAMTPSELVQKAFITGCLQADNVKFGYYKKSGSTWTWTDHNWSVPNNRQMGYFKKGSSSFPIEEGIILTTGIASSAMGPNNTEGKSDLMVAGASDPDLSLLSGQDMNDAAILEFDFVPAGNTMEFKYTFSSEEYLEYINSAFNDAFGFFLSGPGINGTYRNNAVNLAVLPNGDPVTINTIHPAGTNIGGQSYGAQNDEYYVNNPQSSPAFQFDGGTVVLTATYAVMPCQTYHIKLCVADAFDQEFDGAVFLAAKSFNSENVVLTNYGNSIEGQNDIFEGCSDYFRIERSNPDVSQALDLDLVLAGTATNGVDIQTTGNKPFPSHITIPALASYIDIPYYAVADAVADNGEIFTVKIATSCPCATNVVYVEKSIGIYEHLQINSITSTDALCYNQSNGTITVNASNGTGGFDYSKNNGVTWQRSNVFTGLAPGTYTIKVRDPGSCFSSVTGTATVGNPAAIIANAGSPVTICSGQSTQLNGSGGSIYTWSPATGLSATNISNPVATPAVTTTYTLTVTNAQGTCPAVSTVTVTLNTSPAASIAQLNLEICKGGSTTLTASGGNTYVWLPGGATTASIQVSPIITTNYTVTATSANGCTDSKTASVIVNENPTLYNVTGGGSICAGSTGIDVGLSGSQNGVNYQLKLNGANTGPIKTGNGSPISFGNQTLAGTYTVEATMAATSCFATMTGNAILIINPVPTAPSVGIITQPTCTVATGSVVLNNLPSGSWTINPGAITGSGTSYTLSGLTAGTYSYSVTNIAGCTSLPSANIVINAQPVTPTPPTLIGIVQPTCLIATGKKALGGLPAGNWILNPGAIAGSGLTTTISGLTTGTYAYTVTNAAGCTSLPTPSFVINAQPPTPSAPTIGTITQPTCSVATGSLILNNLPTGNWTINPGAISGSGSSYIISGLGAGTYSYSVTNASGCTSSASASAVITAATPPAPITGTITQPTCSVSTGSIALSGLPAGNWTINPGAIAGTGSTKTITGLTPGTYSYTVTNAAGCESATSVNCVINAQPQTPSAPTVGLITQPTCTVATGSVTLNDLPSGNWIINPGTIAGTGSSKTISGLAAGSYSYTVTNAAGCTSLASASIDINPQPNIPLAPMLSSITQPTCSVATGTIILNGLPAGNWTLNPGSIAGNTTSITISGVAAGTYTYTVTQGCTSAPSINIVVNGQPATPSAPTVGTLTQPTCTIATGSVLLNGLPAGNWTINPGAIAGTGVSKTITGLIPGVYNYTVTNSSGCISPLSADVLINSQPVTPSTPIVGTITQPTCAIATGSVILNNLPSGNWTINPGSISGTGSSTTILGIAAGTSTFTVTNSIGCTSSASTNVVINTQPVTPSAPTVGTITQPTCTIATGSVVLNNLPSGNWTINPGAIAGTGTSKTISGLSSGTYNYTVTNAAGCISSASANVVINANPITPSAPIVSSIAQPDCGVATGSVILSGLPAGNWTINPGSRTGSGNTTTISNLLAGTYNYTVTNSVGCTSPASANIVIVADPGTPAAPGIGTVTQPSCSVATGSVLLTGLPAGNWTINPGAITGTGTSTTISGLTTGTYTFTVSNGVGCISLPSISVVIGTQPVTPSAPITGTIIQPTCAVSTGSVILNNLPTGTWTINPGTVTGTGTSITISGLIPGTYAYTVTNSVGCTSPASSNVIIVAATPTAPIVGLITQPTCSITTGSVDLSGLPAGNWTINPGAIVGTGVSTTITGLTAGTYNFTVTQGCTSAASANVVINLQPVTPSKPIVGTITQPTCAVSTGSVVLSGLPAGNWTINPGAINGTGSTTTLTGVVTGTYNYTVTNAVGCVSLPSANAVINVQPATPLAPAISLITQPNCSTPTGSIDLTDLPTGNWIINPGTITGTGTNKTLAGLLAGTYNYTVTNSVGCTSSASANAVIISNPGTPTAPSIGITTQPTCTVAEGSVVLNGLPAGNWTINPGNIAGTGFSTTVSGLVTGTYNFTVTNGSGCISLPSANVIINPQPASPSIPIVSSTTQPTCLTATGSVLLTGLPAGNWTINPGAITGTGASRTVSGLVAGTYNFTVTNSVGCISAATTNIIINTQPAIPSAPAIGTVTQPTCSVATGSVILNGLPSGNWTINPGSIVGSGSSTTLSALAAGTYAYTVTNSVGCTSPALVNVVINVQPATPTAPTIGTITHPTCTVATGSVVLNGLPAGNWTINPGAIAGTGSSTTLSGLLTGTYNYTVSSAAGCTSSASANVVINSQPLTPTAPIAGSITQPTCAVATGSVAFSGLPLGNWIINPGAIAGTGVSKNVSGITSGTKAFTVTNSSGCISPTSAIITIDAQPVTPSAPVVSSTIQPTCSVSTGSIVLSGLPSGNWSINPGAITGNTSSTTITGLFAGTYNYSVTNAAGCISVASSNSVINTQPATPSVPAIGTITQPDCSSATGSVLLSGLPSGNWLLNPGAISGTGTTKVISGLSAGNYAFTVTNASGCTSGVSDNFIINVQPTIPSAPVAGTITQPTCAIATGSVVLSGLPSGNWTINPGSITGTGSSTTLYNLNAGTYVYSVTNSIGCTSSNSTGIVINSQPVTPKAPTIGIITQTDCSNATGSAVLNGLPAGNWTINPGSITGTGPSKTISGLAAGTYTYSVTNAAGCSSSISANLVIHTQPATPTAPAIGSITQPNCLTSTGSIILTGLPSGNWIINPGAISGTGESTVLSGLSAGTYNYSVTNSAGCVSTLSASVVINTQPITPSAPGVGTIIQPECTIATGTAVLTGLPTGNWVINPGSIAGTGSSTTITDLVTGTYSYTVTNDAGCVSGVSANIVINTQPSVPTPPVVGAITQPTCSVSTGSVVLSGLPPRNWTISPGGITGNTSSVTISNLSSGTYNFTVTKVGGCSSLQSVDVVINAQPPTPPAPTVSSLIQPDCSGSTGTISISAPTGIGMTYSINGSTYSNTTGIFSPVTAGNYNITAKTSEGCISSATNVTINNPPADLVFTLQQTSNVSCSGGNDGMIKVSVSGGTGLSTYTISPNVGLQPVSGTFSNLTAQSYTVTATDTHGCTKSISLIVGTTIDVIPPTITSPANVTAIVNTGCTATGIVLGIPVTTDNCGVASVTNNAPSAFPIGITTVKWTVTDNSGNFATCDQTVTVSDNVLPTITCPADITATTNTGCTATGVALGTPVTTDNCGVASVTNNAPSAFPIGVTTVKWTVTDNSGNFATCDQTVTVSDNVLPTITCPADITATTNTGCTATGVALGTPVTTDNCGVASVTNNAPSAFPIGVTTVKWTVTDNSGNFATCDQTVTVSDNQPPTIVCPAPVTVNANIGLPYATGVNLGTPVSNDNCGVASVINDAPVQFPVGSTTVTWTVTDANGLSATCTQAVIVKDTQSPLMNCPPTITVNCINEIPATYTSLVEYTAAGGTVSDNDGINAASFALLSQTSNGLTCPETITRIYTVADINNNFSTCSQLIVIDDKIAPEFVNFPVDVTVQCTDVPANAAIGTDITASDNCDASVEITFINEVRTNGTCNGTYTLTRTWKAVDNCGNSSTKIQTIHVQDSTAPVIATLPAETTINCPAVPVFAVASAIDACGSDFTLTSKDVTTPGSCAGSYSVTRTWTATDACGNSSTASQTIHVQDTTAPVIATLPAETTINCPAVPEFAVASAIDNCGSDFTLTSKDVTTPGSCAGSYSVTRTWTATDACGNSSTASQTIHVQDSTAPVIAALPAETTINCPSVPEFAVASAIDNCGSDFTLTARDVTTPGNCAGKYSVTRTWTATDACGNSSTASQTIHVQDTTAPVITCPAKISVNNDPGVCGATVAVPLPTIIENCGIGSITNSFNQTSDASGLYPTGTTTVLWTVTDNCGNKSTCSMTVTVTDTEAPIIIACPPNIIVCSTDQVVLGTPTVTDNCSDFTLTNNAPVTFEPGITLVVWKATDIQGNSSSCTQSVTISPLVTAYAGEDKPLCSGVSYTFSNATATNYTSLSWTHNGKGTLSSSTALNPIYTPASGEKGSVEFTLSAYGTSGCGNVVATDTLVLTIYPVLLVDAGADQNITTGTSTKLDGKVSGGSEVLSYSWSPAEYLVNAQKLDPATVALQAETVFTLTAIDAISGCSQSDQVTIRLSGIQQTIIANDDYATTGLESSTLINILQNDSIGLGVNVTIIDNPLHGSASLNEDGSLNYTPASGFSGNDTLTYRICDKATSSVCDIAKVIIKVEPIRPDLDIYNLVTPDNDGINDFWYIGGIDQHPENQITIFNRWGTKVREFAGYNNTTNHWDGTNDKSEYLPDGVYFYLLTVKGLKSVSGWVYVRGHGSN